MPTVTRLSGKFRLSCCTLAACALLWAQPAAAAFASFSIPINSAEIDGGASVDFYLVLPNSGSPILTINFVLPRDYDPDTDVRIVFQLLNPSIPDCAMRFTAVDMRRMRAGAPISFALTGLSTTGPTVQLATNVMAQKVFTLAPGGPLPGQQPGDAFLVRFERTSASPSDTCSSAVSVGAIDIRYQIAP
jgi:hypothetical protein